ncbi:MAG: nucleotidyltransferase domain-containing protein [Lentisphaeria bacterium]|nr:nucleotidyltransferase domain-containing protein [Lentisphaeria bacterium]
MRDKIIGILHELEIQQDFKVLFAAESGSRAWGFASPDSDYDVRVIYVKPEAWYWSLDAKQPDTFNAMLPGDLDVSAWELRKTLRLFAGCNPSLNEWFDSPIIYYADSKFTEELRNLIPVYFNPVRTVHHYLALSAKALDDRQQDGTIAVKKLFYALRGLLAAMWTVKTQTMPPTPFVELLKPEYVPAEILSEITRLQEIKARADEKSRIPFPEILSDFFVLEREKILHDISGLSAGQASWPALNSLFYETVKRFTTLQ